MTFDGRVVVEIDTISGLLFRALYSIYWIKIISIFRCAKMEMECGVFLNQKSLLWSSFSCLVFAAIFTMLALRETFRVFTINASLIFE